MLRRLSSIHDEPALEEPVPRVLAVRLRDVETLHVGGITLNFVQEEVRVVVEIPIVEGKPHLLIDPLEGSPALLDQRQGECLFRLDSGLEALQRLRIMAFRHAVVDLA